MKIHEFLLHHGLGRNPFAEEDAQSDTVFKQHCIAHTHHPAWDKIFGNPADPATSVVFGEKGSGKTALRLQMIDHVRKYNSEHPNERLFVIEYDDFNPFLDRFRERVARWGRSAKKALGDWRLWDHMDAILSLGVTKLVDEIVTPGRHANGNSLFAIDPSRPSDLPRNERRDLMLLAALYDQSATLPPRARWPRLQRQIKFRTWTTLWDLVLAILLTIATIATAVYWKGASSLLTPWPWLIAGVMWIPWLFRFLHRTVKAWQAAQQMRVVNHQIGALRHAFMQLGRSELENQPIPSRDRSDDRYELLVKLQAVLRRLGFSGVMIVVDRLDEPDLLGGSPDRMRELVWPMFDNKFLKHPGMGVKLLLPIELGRFLPREDKEFYERSRLDKQNLISSLEWTGQSLYDVANDRLNACRVAGSDGQVQLRQLFDPEVTEAELVQRFDKLRVPRQLFKFMHRLLVAHCTAFSDSEPRWTISPVTLNTTHALFQRDLDAFDRGLGPG